MARFGCARPGAGPRVGDVLEYLLVLPEKDTAEAVAAELSEEEEFDQVRVVRESLAGEDDAEADDWAVYVRVDTLDDESSAPARALAERFAGLADEHGGWLDTEVGGRGLADD